jgi:hypothetical protein
MYFMMHTKIFNDNRVCESAGYHEAHTAEHTSCPPSAQMLRQAAFSTMQLSWLLQPSSRVTMQL